MRYYFQFSQLYFNSQISLFLKEENTTGDMEELSTDDTSKSKTPIKIATSNAAAATTTAAALVPTQGRKIVVKRRMQINTDANPNQLNTTPSVPTCGSPAAPVSTATVGHQRAAGMAKIRKVEQ